MSVFQNLAKYFGRYKFAFLFTLFLGVFGIAAMELIPQAAQLFIDKVVSPALGGGAPAKESSSVFNAFIAGFAPDDYTGIFLRLAVIIGVLLLTRYLVHYVKWNTAHWYGQRAETDLRVAVFNKIITQDTLVLNRYASGELMSIANGDPAAITMILSHHMCNLVDQTLVLGLSIFFLARINPLLMITPLALGLVMFTATVLYIKAMRAAYNKIRDAQSELNSTVQENIAGVRIVRSFAAEQIEKDKFDKKNENYRDKFLSHARTWSKYQLIFNGIGQTLNFSSVIIGIVLAVGGNITVGEFTTFTTYVLLINAPIVNLTNIMGQVQHGLVAANRMFTFLDTNNIIKDVENPARVTGKPDITLSHVYVSLDGREELKDIDVEIPYGKKLGIMGKTGSGKSAMLKTMARFFETTRGETLINGVNVKNIKLDDVRRQFGFVVQDVFLFSNTVDSNIAFYNPDASREAVERAAKIACAHDFITRLADGYETIVGERGLGLSGGQKQRVSIARAILKDAPVLMLDDCTSALDLETERNILKAINENCGDRTLIIASHRASGVQNCDEILFLENGEIAERGTHDELLALKGRYHAVYTAQAAMREGEIDG